MENWGIGCVVYIYRAQNDRGGGALVICKEKRRKESLMVGLNHCELLKDWKIFVFSN